MTSNPQSIRRYGLYYPYFHVRNRRWLKIAALYWPKLVRIVPEDYETRDTREVRALAGDFVVNRPPGPSVEAVAPVVHELVANYAEQLRSRFRIPLQVGDPYYSEFTRMHFGQRTISARPVLAAIHSSQIDLAVTEALREAGLASGRIPEIWSVSSNRHDAILRPENIIDGQHRSDWMDWVVMHRDLVAVYTSVLAEEFAAANMLQPTTDQAIAYAVTNNWSADRIAATLLGHSSPQRALTTEDLPEALGFLALQLAVPANLHTVPIEKIIEIRERYGAEFTAFGQAIDEAAAAMASLSEVRDETILNDYLHDAVASRFAEPLEDLLNKLKEANVDATTLAINVKTQLPAAATLFGGGWISGHHLIGGAGAAAIGLLGIRRGNRQKRKSLLQTAPAISFLLHTQENLKPRTLLDRTVGRLARIASGSRN